ncbi:GGDEF domain-containing protein [Deefgea salmonis]|uniref:diguanylate cyclase n=1 Tax=Deefgea salmonis TaxID=2875502 RepID=A0ABS8BMP9_9NEIS|nr:GGDEF domain-containing protein [Deefgea salmonis]MCB5197010.1 GGDEF domain-containing protein [Deefgea salmonis]
MGLILSSSVILSLAVVSCVVATAQYALLVRAHHSERGLSTLAYGGALHALATLGYAFALNSAYNTAVAPFLIAGLLILLAGTRRFFARPAVLGHWAWSLLISVLLLSGQWLGGLNPSQTWTLQCAILLPLLLRIAYEARHADNDEHWRRPRQVLILIWLGYAGMILFLICLPADAFQHALLITLFISNLALPYSYHTTLSHRLHTRLIKLNRYDALTGLFNRRGIEEYTVRELRRTQKYRQSLAIIGVNIKQFHEINQRYGFAAGDMALKKVGRGLKSIAATAYPSGIGRFTGNDFILVLSNMPIQQVRNTMLEIELAINSLQIEHSDSSFHLGSVIDVVRAGVDGDNANTLMMALQAAIEQRKKPKPLINKAPLSPAEVA